MDVLLSDWLDPLMNLLRPTASETCAQQIESPRSLQSLQSCMSLGADVFVFMTAWVLVAALGDRPTQSLIPARKTRRRRVAPIAFMQYKTKKAK